MQEWTEYNRKLTEDKAEYTQISQNIIKDSAIEINIIITREFSVLQILELFNLT